MYIVVTEYYKAQGAVCCAGIDENFNVKMNFGILPLAKLGEFTVQHSLLPINFSIDRNCNVIQDCGVFDRFTEGAINIILAELVDRNDRTVSYLVLTTNSYVVYKYRPNVLIQQATATKKPVIQNAVIRQGVICTYPHKSFIKIPLEMLEQPRTVAKTPASVTVQPTASVQSSTEPKNSHTKPAKKLTDEQRQEVLLCKKNGIDPRLLKNSKLTPKQMRILWVSKKSGAFSEYFANPALSEDTMKFYADILKDKESVKECKQLLDHPELPTDELRELYYSLCEGVDIKDLIGLPADKILVKRQETLEHNRFNHDFSPKEIKQLNFDIYEKALHSADKR